MLSTFVINGEQQTTTVYVKESIPVPVQNVASTLVGTAMGLEVRLTDTGTKIHIPYSNIVCIVEEPKPRKPFDPAKPPASHWDRTL